MSGAPFNNRGNTKPRPAPAEDTILALLAGGPMTRKDLEVAAKRPVPNALISLLAKGKIVRFGRPMQYALYTEAPAEAGFGRFASVWAYAQGVRA